MGKKEQQPHKIIHSDSVKTNAWWKDIFKKVPSAITFLLPIVTFYFGIIQYFYSQNLIDRRKYINNYYDERYKVLKDLATSTAKIFSIISQKDSLSPSEEDSIKKQLLIFNYTSLVLDKNKPSDSVVLNNIDEYLDCLTERMEGRTGNCSVLDLYNHNKNILENAGKILAEEKDNINSFDFSFFPFGKSSLPEQ